MLGDVLCELLVSEKLVHGCFKHAHVGIGRTPADLTDWATDLLAEHNFDAHNLGAQLSDYQAPLDGFELRACALRTKITDMTPSHSLKGTPTTAYPK